MPFVEGRASSSKGGKPNAKPNNAKGKKPLVKTNVAKRARQNEELDELKRRIATYEPPAEVTQFSQLPLSTRTLRGKSANHALFSWLKLTCHFRSQAVALH
jgi:ATP-dependent RNA helicase DDX10/DBP4